VLFTTPSLYDDESSIYTSRYWRDSMDKKE
jgi:hypothetical protein